MGVHITEVSLIWRAVIERFHCMMIIIMLLITHPLSHAQMVTEEKFTLLFRTHFTVGGGEMDVAVRAMSLPVVVIVHVTQQPPAEATIFWDNAFSETVS